MTAVYNSNKNLKGANVPLQFTQEQALEWAKCALDPIYFIEKYIKVVTIDHGLQPMILYEFQKKIAQGILIETNRVISACARQLGKSSIMAAIMVHYVLFNENKTCAILANRAATAREILSKVQLAYEHLPKWIQQGVLEWNKGSFLLENGSRVLASSTSSSAIRGYTVNMLMLDEFAFVHPNVAEEFFTSVYPTISSGQTSKLAIISTPNGMNLFYKFWVEALAGTNGFTPIKAIWSDVPSRTEKWAAEQLAVLGEQKFAQEMNVEFIGASNTLISGTKLKTLVVDRPVATSSNMRFYQHPEPGKTYVITVDSARGTGNDYSAFIVFDVSTLPYKIAAIFADNTISHLLYPGLIHNIAVRYNNASVLVETNDIGEAVANSLYYDLEYEEVLTSTDGALSSFGGKTPGFKTTKRTKSLGCATMKTLVENDQVIVNDYDLIYELSNFVAKGSSYEAANGHDDLAMCLVMFSYLTTQSVMEDLSSVSAKKRILELKLQKAEDEMVPMGFFDDGTPEEEPPLVF